jgi:hypothetical protein|eukprot:TRINITY_DN83073_c0_g1_i1.p1 TRINITY_DN83073_c0_g1~~TRINITY_DN83073_c0_g1_i1.p1  ORF type:complete len:152 (+),score=15.63 TRINITY_DN83073_c0_g1_i1:10-465(+)
MQPLNSSTSALQLRTAGAMLVKLARTGEAPEQAVSDSFQSGQTSPPVKLDDTKPASKLELGSALKKLARAGIHAAVGAATMGVATAFCGVGMMVSHNGTEGDNGFLLSSGVTIGAIAGLAAGLFTGSYLVGLATFGGISQGMIGLTDWAGK